VNGFLHREAETRTAREQRACSGDVVDQKGVTTSLKAICVGGKPVLPGRIGEAEIEVVLDKTSFVGFTTKDATLLAGVTMKDGQELSVVVNEEMTLSGKASFGSFHILLKHVSRICFEQR